MHEKRWISLLLFVGIGIILAGYSVWGLGSKQKERNILLITIDTIRPDRLSCYSSQYLKTPRIEDLAEKGAVFEKAFAHNPSTLPSHTNILLGTTPLFHGVHDNSKFRVKEEYLTLAEYLKDKGYSTGAFIGAFPLDSLFGLSQGFDVYDDSYPSGSSYMFTLPERKAEKVIHPAVDWIEKQSSKWFSWIHLWDPHTVYSPPEPFRSRFKDDPYSGEVAYVDFELGQLFDFLEEEGLFKNTFVILTGDHGEALGEHGELTHNYFAYNSTLWVPLIMAGPGLDSGRIAEYVSHVDIFPTICDLLNTEKPSFLQGISLLPLIKGKKIKERSIYFESLAPFYNMGCAPLRGFIKDRKKYFDSPLPELYDLEKDFNEEKNLIHRVKLQKYKQQLNELMDMLSSPQKRRISSRVERKTLNKLRSLGYISSQVPQLKEKYKPQDDLKKFLPYQQKLNRAVQFHDEGKKEQSIGLLKEIIQEKKHLASAYLYLQHIYKVQGKIEEAMKVLKDGFTHNPKNYDIVSTYGILLVQKGELDEGIEVLKNALDLRDFYPEVWNHLGLAVWKKGEEQKALEYYKKALTLDETYAEAYCNLGSLYYEVFLRSKKKEDYSRFMSYLKKAIQCDPQCVKAYKGLGAGYRTAGKTDAALSAWKKALEWTPNDGFLLLNVGKVCFERGDWAQAQKYLERYLSLKKYTLSPEKRRQIEALIQRCRRKK